MERGAIERVRAGRSQVKPIATVTAASVEQRYGPKLNEDQQRLVHETLVGRDQIFGIQGGAGTGKTTALTAIKDIADENGYRTLGLGPTSRAAKGLKEAGMDAETLQAFLTRARNRQKMPAHDSFLLTSRVLLRANRCDFLQRLQPQDRVLLIGDTRQHQSVEAGRIFAELQDAGMNTAALSKIVRQKDTGLRHVVEAMASGRIEEGVELLSKQNRVHSVEHRDDRFKAIARAFAESPEGTLVVSPDNNSRRELNAAIRAELREHGTIARMRFGCRY